jgi:probable DNA metabolism protein
MNGQPLSVESFAEWREAARELLAQDIAPHDVQWRSAREDRDLFAMHAEPAVETPSSKAAAPALRLPRILMDMLQAAACFRAPDRWAFLYRVVWRWMHGEKDVISPADIDGARLTSMVKSVHREEHDMHAYLRFRERPEAAGPPRFVGWFEPAHDVLPQVAQHFAARMGRISWLIATPDASVLWDGTSLHFAGPLMRGPADIEDAGETLWLTYYRSIFNPARLNTKVMQSHIPSRFWKNLPEGSQVPGMVAEAAAGARRVGQTATVGQRIGTTIPMSAERAQPHRQAPTSLDQCRRCELWQNATQAVAGVGPQRARIMLIGEQPGDQEDLAGKPFVGPAGQILERAMAQAGMDRNAIFLTNAVKHFKWEPRGKRRLHKTPAQREVEACHYWLEEELARVQPTVLVALGGTALKSITGDVHIGITKSLGQPFRHEGRWVVAIYHPSYVLRVPDDRLRAEALAVMVAGLKEALALANSPAPPAQDLFDS